MATLLRPLPIGPMTGVLQEVGGGVLSGVDVELEGSVCGVQSFRGGRGDLGWWMGKEGISRRHVLHLYLLLP